MHFVQVFYVLSFLIICSLAWLRGGHTERTGVVLLLTANVASWLVQHWRIGELLWAVALIDLVLLASLIRLALRKDRWWPLVACAFQFLALLIYLGTVLVPGFTARSGIVASWALSVITLYSLLGGVLEHYLSGEPPVSPFAVWRSRRPRRAKNPDGRRLP